MLADQAVAVAMSENAIEVLLRIEQLHLLGLRHPFDRPRFLQHCRHRIQIGFDLRLFIGAHEFVTAARAHFLTNLIHRLRELVRRVRSDGFVYDLVGQMPKRREIRLTNKPDALASA